VQQLREAGNILLDIHGQHEFQTLVTRSTGQRELLDAYGRTEPLSRKWASRIASGSRLLNAALELEGQGADRDARLVPAAYQAQELAALGCWPRSSTT
jgi:DNA repair protein RecN (Recombination protein N)